MTLTRKVLAAGAIAGVVAFPISGVFAQSAGSMNDSGAAASAPAASAPAAEGAQAAPAAQIDDSTLQKAAKAYVKVKQIVHQTKQASNGAQPDQSASQSEKIAAVKNEGLDPQQYDQVIQMVQNDPGLQQKFATYVNQNGGDVD